MDTNPVVQTTKVNDCLRCEGDSKNLHERLVWSKTNARHRLALRYGGFRWSAGHFSLRLGTDQFSLGLLNQIADGLAAVDLHTIDCAADNAAFDPILDHQVAAVLGRFTVSESDEETLSANCR